jgi:acyl transferase domain-containing protein
MTAGFAPIAIVGQGCVLPDALDPAALWSLLVEGRSAIGPIPDGRWRADRQRMLITQAQRAAGAEGCLTDLGGWVTGFEAAFDPAGLALDPALLGRLDPLVSWLLHAGRAALAEAGFHPGEARLSRAGVAFGHLAYPSAGLAALAEASWLGLAERPDPLNRFNAGLPADLLCRALGLGAGGFALDAACASSLYAIKLACDRLQAGEVDLMLAGGISRIDPLVLHAGFTALGALSPSGRSRPFHAEADGLLPAEGAALVALKRLDDALADEDRVLAVILGIGLSNDGRSGGLLAPSADGQARAMARAFEGSGRDPASVSLIECHATGTVLGDGTEIESTGRIYAGREPMPIGSIKSNFGHLTTASGAAGLLKIVLGLRHGVLPPTLNCDPLAASVAGSRFRPVRRAEAWPDAAPRIAAISNFGFGGANAHLLVGELRAVSRHAIRRRPAPPPSIAVVAAGARVADGASLDDFRRHLFAGRPRGAAGDIGFRPGEVRFPPCDLERTLPQQLLLLRVAMDAVAASAPLPRETGVFVGAQTDAESCRPGLRLRLPELAPGAPLEGVLLNPLDAAATLGSMPNVPANRINVQLDLHGPGFTVAAEELSGLRALEIAMRALSLGEIDAAIVAAVDLCVEPVHAAAMAAVAPDSPRPGDGAVALIVKREADARRDGDPVLAIIGPVGGDALDWAPYADRLSGTFGRAHAADGLIMLLAAIVALREGQLPPGATGSAARPWPPGAPRGVRVCCAGLGGQSVAIGLHAPTRAVARDRTSLTQSHLLQS